LLKTIIDRIELRPNGLRKRPCARQSARKRRDTTRAGNYSRASCHLLSLRTPVTQCEHPDRLPGNSGSQRMPEIRRIPCRRTPRHHNGISPIAGASPPGLPITPPEKRVSQAAVVEAAVASHLSPDGADRLEAACPRPRRLPRCIPRSSARPAIAARGEKERHRARDMGLDLGAKCIELFSEQRSHDQGHKDQVLKKSGRRREALRGKG
jgi:hypothetical protein